MRYVRERVKPKAATRFSGHYAFASNGRHRTTADKTLAEFVQEYGVDGKLNTHGSSWNEYAEEAERYEEHKSDMQWRWMCKEVRYNILFVLAAQRENKMVVLQQNGHYICYDKTLLYSIPFFLCWLLKRLRQLQDIIKSYDPRRKSRVKF